MDFINRIEFSEQKERRDTMETQNLLDIAKEIGLTRVFAAGLIGCAMFYGFIWAMTLLWVGLGGVL
jgi:hypothetical protein